MLFTSFEELSQVLRNILGWFSMLFLEFLIHVVALENCITCYVVYTSEEIGHQIRNYSD